MTPEDFADFVRETHSHFERLKAETDNIGLAPADTEVGEIIDNALAEAIFLRGFTLYEACLDKLFFHYVTGGLTFSGRAAETYLNVPDEAAARKLVKGSLKFLSWSNPENIREVASTYLKNGWPIADMMATGSNDMIDAEKVRNRIAHDSTEARLKFAAVQRNIFGTERVFSMSAGQLLRVKHRTKRAINLKHLLDVMQQTIASIQDPPL